MSVKKIFLYILVIFCSKINSANISPDNLHYEIEAGEFIQKKLYEAIHKEFEVLKKIKNTKDITGIDHLIVLNKVLSEAFERIDGYIAVLRDKIDSIIKKHLTKIVFYCELSKKPLLPWPFSRGLLKDFKEDGFVRAGLENWFNNAMRCEDCSAFCVVLGEDEDLIPNYHHKFHCVRNKNKNINGYGPLIQKMHYFVNNAEFLSKHEFLPQNVAIKEVLNADVNPALAVVDLILDYNGNYIDRWKEFHLQLARAKSVRRMLNNITSIECNGAGHCTLM